MAGVSQTSVPSKQNLLCVKFWLCDRSEIRSAGRCAAVLAQNAQDVFSFALNATWISMSFTRCEIASTAGFKIWDNQCRLAHYVAKISNFYVNVQRLISGVFVGAQNNYKQKYSAHRKKRQLLRLISKKHHMTITAHNWLFLTLQPRQVNLALEWPSVDKQFFKLNS